MAIVDTFKRNNIDVEDDKWVYGQISFYIYYQITKENKLPDEAKSSSNSSPADPNNFSPLARTVNISNCSNFDCHTSSSSTKKRKWKVQYAGNL